ncbi:thiazole biosynthesis adenylyltransferase ThiF [Kroppenstedtia pulmonis]|uniref:Thiazole biosynthesis adenylyltransferase ThiF n=1 Tax=Kroppenstedtia pulmonis TaxID=1380685 RepID=A0A7D4BII8_9BACL|nr:ThiF family adenylyltransferase [Kroppenstedtia pulmonis]QKG85435.1 thiazole biosynthesis adenylyltransferase ThiF [Kroppenstedtia pulmonis]
MDQERYSRQILFPPIGQEGQEKLALSRVAIVGMGALGTALAHHMVRSGVGYLRLIDRDYVEKSNLQRQMLYDEKDAEEALPKAIAAEAKLRNIHSSVRIDSHVTDLSWRNAETLLTEVDLILDGSDNFSVRYLVNDVSLCHGIPWIYGGAVSSRGMFFTIRPGVTPCLRCLFPDAPAPGSAETCDTAGVIGPVVQVVASYQSTEALKLLVGDLDSLNPKLCHFDLWNNHQGAFTVQEKRQAECPACSRRQFDYLRPVEKSEQATSLCGRDTVQVSPAQPAQLDLKQLEKRLAPLGHVERNRFLLRAQPDSRHRLVVFPDGRVLVQGTTEVSVARSLVARYIGN